MREDDAIRPFCQKKLCHQIPNLGYNMVYVVLVFENEEYLAKLALTLDKRVKGFGIYCRALGPG